ncbi:MAG: ABC transporter ATP-binding protein [Desulfurococcus sp.]|uniref:ABC transporter ATP-binding protein n=1 Tax=Desulfurococcus sp. TaxID=51678 RepID=UPI0031698F23
MSSLVVSNIVKRFGSVVALNLKGRRFEVERGEIFVVIGPSGSGKTTLLRSIAGLETPEEGEIVLDGREVFSSYKGVNVPPEKRNIGYVPQTWALWPHMRVWDNIAFGLKIRKIPKDEIKSRVKTVAEALKIDHLLDRYPWQLSGGQQQRVALARALVLEPSLLLLDEPISNLDAALRDEARVWLRATIKSLRITSLYVTHDIREAVSIGDRIALIVDGVIRRIGRPGELYENPDDPVLAALLRFNTVKGKIRSVSGNKVEIDLGSGSVICSSREEFKPEEEALVIFSPRDLIIGEGALEVRILGSSYGGEYYEILAEIGDNQIRIYSTSDVSSGLKRIRITKCIASKTLL